MNFIYIGGYTLVLVFIWGFFIVAKLHAYKFKNFSHHIEKVTNILLIFLIILSILGYIVLFFSSPFEANTVNVLNSRTKNTSTDSKVLEDYSDLDFTDEINY